RSACCPGASPSPRTDGMWDFARVSGRTRPDAHDAEHDRRTGGARFRNAMTRMLRIAALTLAGLFAAGPATALDLTKKRENLPDLVLGDDQGNDFAVENKDITLESGKAYRLRIVAKGRQEYKFYAP